MDKFDITKRKVKEFDKKAHTRMDKKGFLVAGGDGESLILDSFLADKSYPTIDEAWIKTLILLTNNKIIGNQRKPNNL